MTDMEKFKKALADRKQCQKIQTANGGIISTITNELEIIEKTQNIKILYCVESGSRSWGIPSTDSDYNVRFIYIRSKESYPLSEYTRDVIRWQSDDTLDIYGWDLQKALSLLQISHPIIFELTSSENVYKSTEEWKRISENIKRYFMPIAAIYHYLNTAQSIFSQYLSNETVELKRYFHVLTPLLACKWILCNSTPPPLNFSVLAKQHLENEIADEIKKLYDLKLVSSKNKMIERVDQINDYITQMINEIEDGVKFLPQDTESNKDELNKLFKETINII